MARLKNSSAGWLLKGLILVNRVHDLTCEIKDLIKVKHVFVVVSETLKWRKTLGGLQDICTARELNVSWSAFLPLRLSRRLNLLVIIHFNNGLIRAWVRYVWYIRSSLLFFLKLLNTIATHLWAFFSVILLFERRLDIMIIFYFWILLIILILIWLLARSISE